MSSLYAFLHAKPIQEEKEVIISDRFTDENGNAVPFKIKALTQAENDELTKKSYRTQNVKGVLQQILDSVEYSRRMIVAATVYPDFTSEELCKHYGVIDPLLVPGKMLTIGEYAILSKDIANLAGLDERTEAEIAKN